MNRQLRTLHPLLGWYPFARGRDRLVQFTLTFARFRRGVVRARFHLALEIDPTQAVSRHLRLFGVFEPRETRFFRRMVHPGDVVFDVGANIGWFSLVAATRTAAPLIHAFEPDPRVYGLLAGNARRSGLDIHINNLAVADAPARPMTLILERDAGLNHLLPTAESAMGASRSIVVDAVTIDDYVDLHQAFPDLVKVDVEGAEGLVIAGAARTLGRYRPILICEFAASRPGQLGKTREELIAEIRAHGYAPYRLGVGGRLRPLRFGRSGQSTNVIFLSDTVSSHAADRGRRIRRWWPRRHGVPDE